MTNIEKGVLNSIENAYSLMRTFNKEIMTVKTINGFEIRVQRGCIELLDSDIIVANFDRGYIQLSQIVPLIAEIVEPIV